MTTKLIFEPGKYESIDFLTYVPLAQQTFQHRSLEHGIRHVRLGLISELGEIASELKRVHAYDKPLDSVMVAHLAEEIGDYQWYHAIDFAITQWMFEPNHWRIWESSFLLSGSTPLDCLDELIYATLNYLQAPAPYRAAQCIKACNLLALSLNLNPGECRGFNVAKLKARYPNGFSPAAAEARLDKGGLPHTES